MVYRYSAGANHRALEQDVLETPENTRVLYRFLRLVCEVLVSVSCVSRFPPVSLNRFPPVSFYRYRYIPVHTGTSPARAPAPNARPHTLFASLPGYFTR